MCLGIPGQIVDVGEQNGLRVGRVRFGGICRDVCLEYEPDAGPGDYVLVHVGFAIAKIDRHEAERALRVLEDIGETTELEPEESDA
jgi:hydrogenase expression/formation protein HypC